MKYLVAASLFAALVSAQQIPSCALSCALSQVEKSKPDFQKDPKNCPTLPEGTNALTDTNVQKCLCKTTSFQTAFAACAKGAGCTDKEQCDLWTYSSSLCGGFGPDYALADSLEPAQCKSSGGGSGGGSGGSGGGSSAAPPAGTAAPPAETSAPAQTSAPAESSGAGAAPPAETSAPAASSGAAAPPSYGSPSTVATSAAAGASGAAPSTTPTYVPSSGSTVVLSGAAAVFAGFVALLAL